MQRLVPNARRGARQRTIRLATALLTCVTALAFLPGRALATTEPRPVPIGSTSAAVQALIDAAVADLNAEANGVTAIELRFAAGTYQLDNANPASASAPTLTIAGLEQGALILQGAGMEATELLFTNYRQVAIQIRNADNVTIEDMHLTYPGLDGTPANRNVYTTQGKVEAVEQGGRFVVIRTHPGYPDIDEYLDEEGAQDNQKNLLAFNYAGNTAAAEPRMEARSRKVLVTEATKIGNRLFRVAMKGNDRAPDWWAVERQNVAVRAKVGELTIRVNNSDATTLRNLKFTRLPLNPVRFSGTCSAMVLDGIHVVRAPAIGERIPFFSNTAGGPQIAAVGKGPIIVNSWFEGTGDDAIWVSSATPESPMWGAEIQNNTVLDSQARGINITQSIDGICAGNRLERNEQGAIQVRNNQKAVCTSQVASWTISHNTFRDVLGTSVIRLDSEVAESYYHDAIVIEHNTFHEAPKLNHLLYVDHTQELTFRNNLVASWSTVDDHLAHTRGNALVYVEYGRLVTGDDNIYASCPDRVLTQAYRGTHEVEIGWQDAYGSGCGELTSSCGEATICVGEPTCPTCMPGVSPRCPGPRINRLKPVEELR